MANPPPAGAPSKDASRKDRHGSKPRSDKPGHSKPSGPVMLPSKPSGAAAVPSKPSAPNQQSSRHLQGSVNDKKSSKLGDRKSALKPSSNSSIIKQKSGPSGVYSRSRSGVAQSSASGIRSSRSRDNNKSMAFYLVICLSVVALIVIIAAVVVSISTQNQADPAPEETPTTEDPNLPAPPKDKAFVFKFGDEHRQSLIKPKPGFPVPPDSFEKTKFTFIIYCSSPPNSPTPYNISWTAENVQPGPDKNAFGFSDEDGGCRGLPGTSPNTMRIQAALSWTDYDGGSGGRRGINNPLEISPGTIKKIESDEPDGWVLEPFGEVHFFDGQNRRIA